MNSLGNALWLAKSRQDDDPKVMDIRTVANHLGLSIGTVSRALNGRKDVSPETRQRVMKAAVELGYTPNHAGRSLRSGRMGAIGFVLTMEHDNAVHGAPFFMSVFESVQRGLAARQIDLIVLLARPGEDGLNFLKRHVSRRIVDGWLLSATERDDPRIPFLLDRDIPFVALGRSATPRSYSWIDLDFEGVVQSAMRALFANGHRRIGLIAPPFEINNSQIVIASYRAELDAAGLPFDPNLVSCGAADEPHGEEGTRQILMRDDPPTAVLVMGESAPVGVYRSIRQAGLEPGRDIAVIGLRDNPAAESLIPGLTCFAVSLEDIGAALAETILDQLEPAARPVEPMQKLWPMQLLVRGSAPSRAGG